VNDTVSQDEWVQKYGKTDAITYDQANAVLYDAMDFVTKHGGQTGEVGLSIIRILEALKNDASLDWEEALSISETVGLEKYLERCNPALRHHKKG
jgi:hypothetical protein